MKAILAIFLILATLHSGMGIGRAQAPGVPVHDDEAYMAEAIASCEKLHAEGKLVRIETLAGQLGRTECVLTLPAARREKRLSGAEVWESSRSGCLHVGTFYLCKSCKHWHLNIAGGYAITADGAVATCYHVVEGNDDMKEAYIVAIDSKGEVHPVAEILAACPQSDAAILRVTGAEFSPLALNPDCKPGQAIFCLSSPKQRFGFFTQGIIARFFVEPRAQRESRYAKSLADPDKSAFPDKRAIFMAVTADFAGGSSGSPILDDYGNAVGHVQSTMPMFYDDKKRTAENLQFVQHQATTAREILDLVKRPDPATKSQESGAPNEAAERP